MVRRTYKNSLLPFYKLFFILISFMKKLFKKAQNSLYERLKFIMDKNVILKKIENNFLKNYVKNR